MLNKLICRAMGIVIIAVVVVIFAMPAFAGEFSLQPTPSRGQPAQNYSQPTTGFYQPAASSTVAKQAPSWISGGVNVSCSVSAGLQAGCTVGPQGGCGVVAGLCWSPGVNTSIIPNPSKSCGFSFAQCCVSVAQVGCSAGASITASVGHPFQRSWSLPIVIRRCS
jgi:hypothetical protein